MPMILAVPPKSSSCPALSTSMPPIACTSWCGERSLFSANVCPRTKCWRELRSLTGWLCLRIHPEGMLRTCFEPHWAGQLLGIEIWNGKYDGWAPNQTSPPLLQISSAIPFVGLDFHTHGQSFPLAMGLELQTEVTKETVLQCLRSHRCHARAFGVPLSQNLFRTALPVLGAAEQGRRTLASIARYSRGLTR